MLVKFYLFKSSFDLGTRLRSPKSNQILSLSSWYIYVSLNKIHPLVQEISYIQDYDLENGGQGH